VSQIQETEIEGSPSSIENVATYLRSTLSGASSTWSGDVDSGRTKATGAWSGAAADAFAGRVDTASKSIVADGDEASSVASQVSKLASALTTAQQKMADARATAYGGGLTVSGTQIHGPGNAPSVQLESAAPYAETPASASAGTSYSKKVTAWNTSVEQATGGYDAWQQALDAFSKFWNEAGGNFTSLTSGLLTTGVTAGTLANSAYRLQSVKVVNTDRLVSADKALAQMVDDGRITVPKSTFYALSDEALAARTAISSADDMLVDGLRVGSKVSKGLWALGIAGTGYAIYDDMQHGESAVQATTSNVGGFQAGVGAGAGVGGIVGSCIVPPAGTIVGAAVGGIISAGVGIFTSGAIDHLFEDASAGFTDTSVRVLTSWRTPARQSAAS